jgi:hypothetical protein
MGTNYIVNEKNELREKRLPERPAQPVILKIAANLISYVFHPLFLPVYIAWFLVRIQPYLFAGFDEWTKMLVLIQSLVMYTFFPLITVLLLKGLRFIDSIQLRSQKDRIIPYVASMFFYFWAWYVSKNLSYYPDEFVYFRLAVFIASILAFMANIFFKVSMHTVGAGVVATFICLIAFFQSTDFGIYITVALLVAGLVATARLILSDHSTGEIYMGFVVGIISQLTAYWITT